MRKLIILICLIISSVCLAQIPVGPVADTELAASNTVVSLAEGVMNFLLKKERPLQENIKDVQDFFLKAKTAIII